MKYKFRIKKLMIIYWVSVMAILASCTPVPAQNAVQPTAPAPTSIPTAVPNRPLPSKTATATQAPLNSTATPAPVSIKNINRSDFPISGAKVPALAGYDDAMWIFMQSNDIHAGVLTVSKNGRVIFSHGYGWLDANHTSPVPPDAFFRAASPNKMLTAIAIKQLIQKNQLSMDTKLIPLLKLEPIPGMNPDPTMNDITVAEALDTIPSLEEALRQAPTPTPYPGQSTKPFADILVSHQGEVQRALGLSGPPTSTDIARYIVSNSMNFIRQGGPRGNEKLAYLFLGLAVEKVSGQSYYDYVQKNILVPLKISDVKLAHSLPAQREPNEPFYISTVMCDNVFSVNPEKVLCADGGFSIEAMAETNGLVFTGSAIAKLMTQYSLRGDLGGGNLKGYSFYGFLPGSTIFQLWEPGDVQVVMFVNRDLSNETEAFTSILNNVTKQVQNWP